MSHLVSYMYKYVIIVCSVLYFENSHIISVFESQSDIVIYTKAAEQFFSRNKSTIKVSDIEEKRFYNLDWKSISEDNDFLSSWCSFKDDIVEHAEKTINCLGLALHQVCNIIYLEFLCLLIILI